MVSRTKAVVKRYSFVRGVIMNPTNLTFSLDLLLIQIKAVELTIMLFDLRKICYFEVTCCIAG